MTVRIASCIILIICLFAPIAVDADCHDSMDCEDISQVVGFLYWDESDDIPYYVNNSYPNNMPYLSTDVNAAAAEWNGVADEVDVPFGLDYEGETTKKADIEDGTNTVGYRGLTGHESDYLAVTQLWTYQFSYRIKEADIIYNYYHSFDTHTNVDSSEYCIQNIAAHEWGHFAGLRHVNYKSHLPISNTNCPEYVHYTMFATAGTGEHIKESVSCEDELALKDHYDQHVN